MKNIPNAISLINLFTGCVALVFIFDNQPVTGALLIVVCSVLDYFDGAAARLLKAHSETGKQLDSLADLVSFGMAPAGIMYFYLYNSLHNINHDHAQIVLSSVAFLIAVFSALRLARFNTEKEPKDYFIGLPTPANALLIVSIPLTLAATAKDSFMFKTIVLLIESPWFNLLFIAAVSFLLISPVKMFSLKIKSLKWSDNRVRIIFIAGCAVLLITFGWAAMPFLLIFYIILSLLWPVILPEDWR